MIRPLLVIGAIVVAYVVREHAASAVSLGGIAVALMIIWAGKLSRW